MKIVVLTPIFKEKHYGGEELVSYNIARRLAELGNEIHVVSRGEAGLPEESAEDNFLIHRILCPGMPLISTFYFWITAFFLIKKIRPDLVHCLNVQMGPPCYLNKKFFGTPFIVFAQGMDVYSGWKFKKTISEIVFRNANKIVALTENMKSKMPEKWRKDIIVIPNGVDLKKFEGIPKEKSRKNLGLKDGEKIILNVGVFQLVKGTHYLIEAFDILRRRMPEARLILVGGGKEKNNLENLAKEKGLEKSIKFTGFISNDEIPEYMAAADVYVLPSTFEGLPVVILECLASGLPIVATKIGAIPDIVEDKKNGFLAEPKNPGQIAEKILQVLSLSQEEKSKISSNNKEKAKNYSWDLIIDSLLKIYNLCCQKK